MAKVMTINSGSSSLKFKLYEMPEEKVICSGNCERIGLADGIFTIKYDGKKDQTFPVQKASPSEATTLDMFEIGYLLSKLTVGKFMTKKVISIQETEVVEEKAEEILDNKPTAWLDPCDEIITEQVKHTYLVTIKNSELSLNIPAYTEDSARIIAEDLGFNINKIVKVR